MLGALLYLRWTSFQNWMRSRGRRLKQPKYLIGAIVGCAYFYFFFIRSLGDSPARHARHATSAQAMQAIALANARLPFEWLPAISAVAALALLVFLTLMWIVPVQRAALGFSEAEIAFLFPAPVTRRTLVHFRLLSAQFRSLVGAGVMMLFSNRWTAIGGNAATHAVGWWFIFSALNLHFSGANFTLTRFADRGLRVSLRRIVVFILVAGIIGITVARLPVGARLPRLGSDNDFQPGINWLITITNTAPLAWLLWPFKVVLGPFLAPDLRHFLLALGPALAVITLHYLWVVHTAVAFEDASVEYAEKRGARLAAWRSGERRIGHSPTKSRRPPFQLAGTGRPEFAFLWKNLLSTWEYFNRRVLVATAVVIVGTCLWLNLHSSWRGFLPGVGAVALMLAAYTLIVGPQFARQDIRADLSHADVLKTYPLSGWQIILGELLTPITILSVVMWLTLLTVALTLHPSSGGEPWVTPQVRVVATLALGLVVPALVTLQLLVPNAAALYFPGWFQTSRTRGGGPEIIGQRMIFFFAQLVAMLFALLPAFGLGGLILLILHVLAGPVVAIVVATPVVLTILGGEIWCGIWLLGERFEKLDLSAELRP